MAPTAPADVPCLPYLEAFPHPAFAFALTARSLVPAYANPAARKLLPANTSLENVLKSADQASALGEWLSLAARAAEPVAEALVLEFASGDALELTQTKLGDWLICTSASPRPIPVQPTIEPESFSERHGFSDILPGGGLGVDLAELPHPTQLPTPPLSDPKSNEGTLATKTWFAREAFGPRAGSCVELLETLDWARTPLGPREQWGAALVGAVTYALSSPFPTCVWWGAELTLIYNQAYADMAGSKHPNIYGRPGAEAWAELWGDIGPLAGRVMQGETVYRTEDLLFFDRLTEADLPEEVYHNWCYVPVRDKEGKALGIINQTIEATQKVITERRMSLLRELSTSGALARTYDEYIEAIMNVFKSYPLDAPFAALYQTTVVESPTTSPDQVVHTDPYDRTANSRLKVHLALRETVGVPDEQSLLPAEQDLYVRARIHPGEDGSLPSPPASEYKELEFELETPIDRFPAVAPSTFRDRARTSSAPRSRTRTASTQTSLRPRVRPASADGTVLHGAATKEGFWPFRAAFAADAAVHVEHLPTDRTAGFDARGWGEAPREAVLVPLSDANGGVPAAVLALGLNSRRPYDAAYRSWVDLVRLSLNALLEAVRGRAADAARAEQLAQLDEAKTAFFSNASHEFRTPLTLIQGPLADAIPHMRPGPARENLEIALRNAARLKRLVDSLLDFSKLAAKKLEGRFRPVALGPYTADLASLFNSVIKKAHVKYTVDCGKDESTVAYIDPDFWEKIVVNLIGNAFKYTLEGSISVSMEAAGGYVHLSVTDTGVGVPPADIEKVFDRFHRSDSVGRSYEGTGVGLALTKELVILHGGRISLKSLTAEDAGAAHGSRFTVSLPLGKEHLPAAHVDASPAVLRDAHGAHMNHYSKGVVEEAGHWGHARDESAPESAQSEGSGASTESSKLDPSTLFFSRSDTILLVDDSADLRRYVRSLLAPFCTIVESVNGEEALRVVSTVKPNLIISDVMMPGLDGFGLISKLRQQPDTRLLPIILLTAKETEEARVEGLLSGADDYLAKPFNAKELIARAHLQMQLGKRRAQLETLFQARTREIQVLSDLSPVGLFRANADGQFTYVNQRWRDITGVPAAAKPSFESMLRNVHIDDIKKVHAEWVSTLESREMSSFEHRFKNGNYAQEQWEPLTAESGEFNGFIGTITDISAQRKLDQTRIAHAEERERFAQERAEAAETRRKEADERRRGQELLIDVTSHELRQPVNAILNCASVLRANLGALYEELRECQARGAPYKPGEELLKSMLEDLDAVDAVYQCCLAQERIANDVLSLSRIQLGALSIHPVDFQPIEEAKGLLAIFNKETSLKRISVQLNIGESFKQLGVRHVRADKARFRQILTNLLSNGIKFTDMSSDAREITVTLNISRREPEDGWAGGAGARAEPRLTPEEYNSSAALFVHCSVKDSGPGIQPDDLALLFQRFQQGTNSEKVFGGSGLGLFVSRKLCDLMDGRISVVSEYGHGATFQFYIKVLAVARQGSPPPGTAPPLAVAVRSRGLRVLLVEDNVLNQTILNRQLKGLGCTTTLANNGLQAIDRLRVRAESVEDDQPLFDIILMDCEMPVMDGLTATREIRRMEAAGELHARSLIFALTGNAREAQVQNARNSGMDDVMIKPYRLNELMNKVLEAIVRRDSSGF